MGTRIFALVAQLRNLVPCKVIQDSIGFPDSRYWIVDSLSVDSLPVELGFGDSEFLELKFGFQSPEFRIPQAKMSRIPKSGIAYMGRVVVYERLLAIEKM